MPVKKKKVTKRSTNKPLVKQVLPKSKPKKRRPSRATPSPSTQAGLGGVGEVFVLRQGEVATLHITINPEIKEVTLTLNGRGVFKGQP